MSSMLASKYQRYGFVYKEPFEPGDPDYIKTLSLYCFAFLAPTGALEEVIWDLCLSVCVLYAKKFLKHSKESRGVLRQESKQASRQGSSKQARGSSSESSSKSSGESTRKSTRDSK